MEITKVSGGQSVTGSDVPDFLPHAPTLLGGAEPGSQGIVRVWSPNVWLLRAQFILTVAPFVFTVLMAGYGKVLESLLYLQTYVHHDVQWRSWFYGGMAIWMLFQLPGSWKLIRRPRSITTDDSGIAVITSRATESLRWEEIRACRLLGAVLRLETDRGKVVTKLLGYSTATSKELFATIAQRSNLYLKGRFRCVRADRLDGRPGLQPEFPSPSPRREKSVFVLSAVLGVFMVLTPVGLTAAMVHLEHEVRASIPFPLPTKPRSSGIGETVISLANSFYREPHSKVTTARRAIIEIYVAQKPGDGLALPSVPGFRYGGRLIEWSPVAYENAGLNVYHYRLNVWWNALAPPAHLRVRLDYGSRVRWVEASLSHSHFFDESDGVPVYSNNWGDSPAAELSGIPTAGPLPAPSRWQFAAISVERTKPHPSILDFHFDPAPAIQETALGWRQPTSAAAWLLGTISSSGLWCEIRYRDGSSRRVRVDSGSPPAGIRIQWGLTPMQRSVLLHPAK